MHVVEELRSQGADVSLFVSDVDRPDQVWRPDWAVSLLTNLTEAEVLEQLGTFDIAVYNLGDHLPYHEAIYEVSTRHPGLVILHDLVMHHFFHSYYLQKRSDSTNYVRELMYSHGQEGLALGLAVLHGAGDDVFNSPHMLQCNMSLSAVRAAYGVMVHSRFAAEYLQRIAGCRVKKSCLPMLGVTRLFGQRIPNQISGPKDKMRLLTYGRINRNKRVPDILETIAASPKLRGKVFFTVVGAVDPVYGDMLKQMVQRLQLTSQVDLILEYRPDDYIHDQLASSDVVVNLRDPHFGESSAVLVEAVSLGKPTIVWRHGSYDELPDDVVVKVDSFEQFRTRLEELVESPAKREKLSAMAVDYARSAFDLGEYCSTLLSFVAEVRYDAPALELVDTAVALISEMGPDVGEALPNLLLDEIRVLAQC